MAGTFAATAVLLWAGFPPRIGELPVTNDHEARDAVCHRSGAARRRTRSQIFPRPGKPDHREQGPSGPGLASRPRGRAVHPRGDRRRLSAGRHRRRGTCLGRRLDRLCLGHRSHRRHRQFRARHSGLVRGDRLRQDGETVVGVIHEPSTGETFHGRRGGGAFVNGRPIKASAATELGTKDRSAPGFRTAPRPDMSPC